MLNGSVLSSVVKLEITGTHCFALNFIDDRKIKKDNLLVLFLYNIYTEMVITVSRCWLRQTVECSVKI